MRQKLAGFVFKIIICYSHTNFGKPFGANYPVQGLILNIFAPNDFYHLIKVKIQVICIGIVRTIQSLWLFYFVSFIGDIFSKIYLFGLDVNAWFHYLLHLRMDR